MKGNANKTVAQLVALGWDVLQKQMLAQSKLMKERYPKSLHTNNPDYKWHNYRKNLELL